MYLFFFYVSYMKKALKNEESGLLQIVFVSQSTSIMLSECLPDDMNLAFDDWRVLLEDMLDEVVVDDRGVLEAVEGLVHTVGFSRSESLLSLQFSKPSFRQSQK